MNGPKFVQYFSPVIDALKELGGSGRPAEVRDVIAKNLDIPEQERTELMHGGAPRFDNQVAWARFYLVKAGILDSSKRGVWSLSDKGRLIDSLPYYEAINLFKEVHAEFQDNDDTSSTSRDTEDTIGETIAPNEISVGDDSSYRKKLLEIVLSLSTSWF
jgi:restriction system protein